MPISGERLDVLKALGDNTRYAIYLELARSPSPLSTSQISETLGLHGNTVRPHLERMKEVGLLESRSEAAGTVGRPQKLYSLAEDAPSLGLEPPVFPMLARMLIDLARVSHVDPEAVLEAGRVEGRRRALGVEAGMAGPNAQGSSLDALEALVVMQQQLGFDPAVFLDPENQAIADPSSVDSFQVDEPQDHNSAIVAFAHCPFAELAVQNPAIVCALHRGLIEGFMEADEVLTLESFNDVVNREPCRMELAVR